MKKIIYQIHRFLGITVGFILFLMAISGIGITFRNELMPVIYHNFFAVTPKSKKVTVDIMAKNLYQYLDGKELHQLYSSPNPYSSYIALYKEKPKTLPRIIAIDQYTGEIKAEMKIVQNIFAIMLFFHSNLFLGSLGKYTVGVTGLLLGFFVLSGLYLWLPNSKKYLKAKLRYLFNFNSGTKAQKTHHGFGILFSIPLLISGLTGFLIIFDLSYELGKSILKEPTRVEERELTGQCPVENQLKALNLISKNDMDNLISVHFCHENEAVMKISYGLNSQNLMAGYRKHIIDPLTFQELQVYDSDLDPKSWNFKRLVIYPLHTGELFGDLGRVINALTGIALATLVVSGLTLYRRRRKKASTSDLSLK
jgi:sulfite reductase (NADPH) flavoprotein alpha-component